MVANRVAEDSCNLVSYLRPVTAFLMELMDDWSASKAYLSDESIRTLCHKRRNSLAECFDFANIV